MSELTQNISEQAREAERAVLGGLMLETDRFDTITPIINHEDFQGKDHQLIYQSMFELIEENKPLDPLTVSEKLDNKNLLNKIGGKNYLIELATTTPTAASATGCSRTISSSAARSITPASGNPTTRGACLPVACELRSAHGYDHEPLWQR